MNLFSRYGAIFKMGLSDAMEYRFNFFTQIILWYFPLVIEILLWNVVYKSFGNSTIAGFTLNGMITYYIIVMMVNELVKTEGIEWSVISDIRDGYLQRYLIQPIDFLMFKLVYIFSKKVVVLVCIGINLIPIIFFFHKIIQLPFIPLNILYFGISLLFSLMIFYFIQVSIAMLSFWFTEFSSIFHFLPFIFSVLNGTAFPLNLLPGWLHQLLSYTPFYYTVYFPTQVLTGNLSGVMIAQGFLVQTIWLLFGFALCKLVWFKGIQQFSATGG